MKLRYLSLFSGIGGIELGIQQAYENKNTRKSGERTRVPQYSRHNGDSSDSQAQSREDYTCIGYSEIDRYAIQVYEKHFNHKKYGDVTKINPSELPDFDLIVGGFPCQSFSIAGKRGGFEDTRGTLFFNIAEIARVKRPRLLFLENVKGLLSHNEGNTFATIISTLDELGYDCQWQVLNSKNFGVPQNRERVFIIGHTRGTPRPEVFPIGESNPKALKQLIGGGQGNRVYDPSGIATTQASQAGGQGAKTGLYAVPVITPDRPKKRQNGRRFKENGEPSFTLTGQDKHGVLVGRKSRMKKTDIASTLMARDYKGIGNQAMSAVMEGAKIRRLTPLECERLQGFPDNWTEGISDTQRYKCCGNAVTVNVIQAIMERLINKNN